VGGARPEPFGSALVQRCCADRAQAAQAFDALSARSTPAWRPCCSTIALYSPGVLGRLRQASFGDEIGPMAALSSSGPRLPMLNRSRAGQPCHHFGAVLARLRAPDTVWWGRASAHGPDRRDGAAAVSRDLAGFFNGVDSRFGDNWRAASPALHQFEPQQQRAASSADINAVHFAATRWRITSPGTANWCGLRLEHDRFNRSSFSLVLPIIQRHAMSGHGQLFGELGYGVALGASPQSLRWHRLCHSNTNGFSETGVWPRSGSGNAGNVGYSTLGARIAAIIFAERNGADPRVSLAWQHAFGDVTPSHRSPSRIRASDSASQVPARAERRAG